MNFRKFLEAEVESFQMAPLIDIVFNCLVFYVVTSAIAGIERQMDINVPTAEQGKLPQRPRAPYYINITRDGSVIINNRARGPEELRNWLRDLHDSYGGSPPPVVIRADRDTAFQHFVRVLDACAAADVRNVAYANIEERPRGE